MPTARQIGAHFEQLACQFLTAQGLWLVATNYSVVNVGEIDIIATHPQTDRRGTVDNVLVFVEVKAYTQSQWLTAKDAVTMSKQRRIVRTAEHFLQQNEQFATMSCRFDVVAFEVDERGNWGAEWLQGAFLVA